MNGLFSVVLGVIGIIVLLKYKQYAILFENFYNKRLEEKYKNIFFRKKYLIASKIIVIFFGISLLIVAFHFSFGTIYLNGAQP